MALTGCNLGSQSSHCHFSQTAAPLNIFPWAVCHFSQCLTLCSFYFINAMQEAEKYGKVTTFTECAEPHTILCEGQCCINRCSRTCLYVGAMKTLIIETIRTDLITFRHSFVWLVSVIKKCWNLSKQIYGTQKVSAEMNFLSDFQYMIPLFY